MHKTLIGIKKALLFPAGLLCYFTYMVAQLPSRGLEPLSLATYAPEAYVYTNSTTTA